MADATLERWRANARRGALTLDLYSAIEVLLLNHADDLQKPPAEQDSDLAELAHVYERLTGFDPIKEAARD